MGAFPATCFEGPAERMNLTSFDYCVNDETHKRKDTDITVVRKYVTTSLIHGVSVSAGVYVPSGKGRL